MKEIKKKKREKNIVFLSWLCEIWIIKYKNKNNIKWCQSNVILEWSNMIHNILDSNNNNSNNDNNNNNNDNNNNNNNNNDNTRIDRISQAYRK